MGQDCILLKETIEQQNTLSFLVCLLNIVSVNRADWL